MSPEFTRGRHLVRSMQTFLNFIVGERNGMVVVQALLGTRVGAVLD